MSLLKNLGTSSLLEELLHDHSELVSVGEDKGRVEKVEREVGFERLVVCLTLLRRHFRSGRSSFSSKLTLIRRE